MREMSPGRSGLTTVPWQDVGFDDPVAFFELSGYFDHIKELHKSTVFFESEKEKWLENVRPIAKDLYESEDEDEE